LKQKVKEVSLKSGVLRRWGFTMVERRSYRVYLEKGGRPAREVEPRYNHRLGAAWERLLE